MQKMIWVVDYQSNLLAELVFQIAIPSLACVLHISRRNQSAIYLHTDSLLIRTTRVKVSGPYAFCLNLLRPVHGD